MKKVYIIGHLFVYVFLMVILSSFASAIIYNDDENFSKLFLFDDASGDFLDYTGSGRYLIPLNYSEITYQEPGLSPSSSYSIKMTGNNWLWGDGDGEFMFPSPTDEPFTIGMWVKFVSWGQEARLMSNIGGAGGWGWHIILDDDTGGGNTAVHMRNSGSATASFGHLMPMDTVLFLGIWWNGTGLCAIVNDTKYNCQEWAQDMTNGDAPFVIGRNAYTNATPLGDVNMWIDDVFHIERALTDAELSDNWLYGISELSTAPEPPTIVAPSPVDNSHNNTNVTLNVTHDTVNNDVNYYLYFGNSTPLDETDLYVNNGTRDGDEHKAFLTNVSDGIFYWKWKIQNTTNGGFSSNTSERTLYIDTVNPTITVLVNTTFDTDNSTIISSLLYNMSINISFFDTYLYQTLINITNETDESVYSILNTSITGTTANYSRIVNLSSLSIGNYTIKLIATDSHTAKKIGRYGVIRGLDYLRYTTTEGNIIKIKSDTLPLSRYTNKLKDRYDFKFNFLFQKAKYKFIVESYNKIDYIENSEYNAHFVIMGENNKGNWLDFDNPYLDKKDYKIKKIDDYTYEVEINSKGLKSFTFSSLGGLNTEEKHYLFRIGAVIDVWVSNDETGQSINATVTIGSQSAHTIGNTNAARLFNITKEITSLTLNASGYGTETETISITQNYHNLTLGMTEVSAVKGYFYDERSGTLIEGETFSTYLETTGYSNLFSAATNPYTFTGLPTGSYKIKASSTNYPERQYLDLAISNETTTNINLYFINSTDGSEITFNVLDSNSDDIEDVDVDFYRIINGTLTLMAGEQTDYGGEIRLYLDTNYEYTINFTKTNYQTKTISLEPSTAGSPYIIYLDDETPIIPPLAVSYTIKRLFKDGIDYNLTYTNTSKVVHLGWNDRTDYVDSVCLNVYDLNSSFYSNCSTPTSGYMNFTITIGNKTYMAKASVEKGAREYTLKIIDINLLEIIAGLGVDMVIISWIVFLVLALIGLANPVVSIILGTFGLTGMYLIGALPIGFGTIMGIISVAIINIIAIRRSRR